MMHDPGERWKRKPLLDENPWSLLRPVGLARRTARVVMAGWVIAAPAALSIHEPFEWGYAVVGILGLLMLRYVLQRLRGVPAEFIGPGEAVTEDWAFQIRLFIDIVALLLLAWSVATLVLGFEALRAWLS
ncbi:hypothetical protein [Rubrivivax gelatinosus]|nr:hypothetical protein [Rubrivivax gelatinosus]